MNPLALLVLASAGAMAVSAAVGKQNRIAELLNEFFLRRSAGEPPGRILSQWYGVEISDFLVDEVAEFILERGRLIRGLDMNRRTQAGVITPHWGVDLGFQGCLGEPVYAAKTGIVSLIEPTIGYGNIVGLSHLDRDDESSLYAHLQYTSVGVGQLVEGGQQVGAIGNTTFGPDGQMPAWGATMGPHLHMEIHPRRIPQFGPRVRRLDPISWAQDQGIELFHRTA